MAAESDVVSERYQETLLDGVLGGAPFGRAGMVHDAKQLAKADINATKALCLGLSVHKNKSLEGITSNILLDPHAMLQIVRATTEDLLPEELGGGAKSGLRLVVGKTCTPEFHQHITDFIVQVQSTSPTMRDPLLCSTISLRESAQALLRSQSGEIRTIYNSCVVGGSSKELVYNVRKWTQEEGEDDHMMYYVAEMLEVVMKINAFPKYTKAVHRAIRDERIARVHDPFALLTCLHSVANRIIRGDGILSRRSAYCDPFHYPDGDWDAEKLRAREAQYVQYRCEGDPPTLKDAEDDWGIRLGPANLSTYDISAYDEFHNPTPTARFTSVVPEYDVKKCFFKEPIWYEKEDEEYVIDILNQEDACDLYDFQELDEVYGAKNPSSRDPIHNRFIRDTAAQDLKSVEEAIGKVVQSRFQAMETKSLIALTGSVQPDSADDLTLPSSTSLGEAKALASIKDKKTGEDGSQFANALSENASHLSDLSISVSPTYGGGGGKGGKGGKGRKGKKGGKGGKGDKGGKGGKGGKGKGSKTTPMNASHTSVCVKCLDMGKKTIHGSSRNPACGLQIGDDNRKRFVCAFKDQWQRAFDSDELPRTGGKKWSVDDPTAGLRGNAQRKILRDAKLAREAKYNANAVSAQEWMPDKASKAARAKKAKKAKNRKKKRESKVEAKDEDSSDSDSGTDGSDAGYFDPEDDSKRVYEESLANSRYRAYVRHHDKMEREWFNSQGNSPRRSVTFSKDQEPDDVSVLSDDSESDHDYSPSTPSTRGNFKKLMSKEKWQSSVGSGDASQAKKKKKKAKAKKRKRSRE